MILDIKNGDYGWKIADKQTGEDIPAVHRADTETGEIVRQKRDEHDKPVLNAQMDAVELITEIREFTAIPLSYCCGPNAPRTPPEAD